MVETQRFLAGMRRFALSPDVKFRIHLFDCRPALRLSLGTELGKILVCNGKAPRGRLDGRFDPIAVRVFVYMQIRFQSEAGSFDLEQFLQTTSRKGKRLDRVPANRLGERVHQRAKRAYP